MEVGTQWEQESYDGDQMCSAAKHEVRKAYTCCFYTKHARPEVALFHEAIASVCEDLNDVGEDVGLEWVYC